MNKTKIFILLAIGLFLSFNSNSEKSKSINEDKKNYILTGGEDQVIVEKFDSTNTDINKYNSNNVIYKVGERFVYSFEHISPENKIKFFKKTNDKNSWEFVDSKNTDPATIKTVAISVADGNPMSKVIPNYNQTALTYKLGQETMFSISGAIENEKNVWIHPPRDNYFRILELNPFPYIKAPYKIGTKWIWKLKIGDQWADKRWKTWKGEIENKYFYEIIDKKIIKTDLGKLDCFVINSKAKSRIGETQLIAYFNPEYWFVMLNYINIDSSKTNLELIEHSSNHIRRVSTKQ